MNEVRIANNLATRSVFQTPDTVRAVTKFNISQVQSNRDWSYLQYRRHPLANNVVAFVGLPLLLCGDRMLFSYWEYFELQHFGHRAQCLARLL
jgi:hypothetical protein